MIELIVILFGLILVIVTPVLFPLQKEPKGEKSHLHSISIRPTASHPAIPLRNPVRTWIVNVPLTPFRAPLKRLPPVDIPHSLIHPSITAVRNQGDCGSCWAFAICDSLSDRIYHRTKRSGRGAKLTLSPQHLLNCYDPTGCEGGSPEECVIWMAKTKFRVTTASRIPYKASSGGGSGIRACTSSGIVGVGENSVISIVEFIPEVAYDHAILKQNILNMKRELVLGGPIYSAISVYDDLFRFTGDGVYEHDPKSTIIGGHAIEIIGYVGNQYWICKNSWGKEWPRQSKTPGYFKVKMGVNMCGIESRCGTAEPILYGERRWDNSECTSGENGRFPNPPRCPTVSE